jgi:Flp pilus assembly protein TadG
MPRTVRDDSERGAVAVEFALVMVPLLVLLFGSIQYGLYFWAMQGGSDIARSMARQSAVGDVATTTCDDFRDDIRSQIDGLTGRGETATIRRTFIDSQTPADGVTPGDKVRISVQFKSADLHFPFVPFVHDGMVSSTAESRVDFVPDPDNPPEDCE